MIYHYCNTTAFNSIISTKNIWLTDITKLNDKTEYKAGFDIILEILKNKGFEKISTFQDIHTDKLSKDFQILVGCFSKEGDAGSQWRSYADESRGISIGFDEELIKMFNLFNRFTENEFQPIGSRVDFSEVNYDRSDFSKKVTRLINMTEKRNDIFKNKIIAFELRRLAATYKDPYFKDEREIRAIVEIESNRNDKYALDERFNAYKENAVYHNLKTSYLDSHSIKEVIIGANCSYTKECVKWILHKHGLEGVKILDSSGRGRYRTA